MAQHVEIRASGNGQEPLGDPDGLKVKIIDPATGDAISWADSNYEVLTDSGLVKTGAGAIDRIAVAEGGTSITINVYDNTSGTGTLLFGPHVIVDGESIALGGAFGVGCYVTFSGTTGTPSITVFFR